MKTAIVLIGLTAGTSLAADLPPLEDYLRPSAYSSAKISPNGKYLGIIVDRGEQDVLTVLKMSDLSISKVNVLPDEKSVANFSWVGDERLMFTATRKFGAFAAPFSTGEWFAVNADGTRPETLIDYGTRSGADRRKSVGNARFSMADALDEDENIVLMEAITPRSMEGVGTEMFQVNTFTGARKSLGRAPRENCGLTLDEKKEVRYALCTDSKDASGQFDEVSELYRRDDAGKWTLVNQSKSGGKDLRVLGTAKDGTIYALQDDRKVPAAFGTVDRETGEFNKLFQDPVTEVSGWVASPTDEKVLALMTEAGAPRITLVEEEHPDTELYAQLAGAFPGQVVNFSSHTRDGQQIIVSVYSDRNPGELYLYDRGTGKARFLLKGRDWVDTSKSASIRSFSFKSRDGLLIHGYLTIPKGSSGKNLPLIVNPHGGPMGPRDNWRYNPELQMFASRGYATLQVNFRGSGGFGKAFQDMAYGNWATGIMNDIIDATKWAIQDGVADPERICIYGASFGGYSALMAPARDQELFKCAFGYVGMYDSQIQFKLSDTGDRGSGIRYLERAFGATRAEQDAMSPINHASKITIPVFMAAGARDARCPPEHTEKMFKALELAGNKPEGMIIGPGEGHGFYDMKNKVDLYTQMLSFFGRHIGGTVEVGDPEQEKTAAVGATH
jgi:dipeptidyl aminopeptidase/acylaminoacyl peptidase